MTWLTLIRFGAGLLANWQRLLIYGALALSVAALLIGYGYHKGSQRLFEHQAAQARAAVKITRKQGAVTEKVITRYVEVAAATRTVTEYVDREVIRYAENNPGLCLDPDWRRLHDRAAANQLPDPSRPVDGALRTPPAAP
jgi:hypothetical protein